METHLNYNILSITGVYAITPFTQEIRGLQLLIMRKLKAPSFSCVKRFEPMYSYRIPFPSANEEVSWSQSISPVKIKSLMV